MKSAGRGALEHASPELQADSYLQRLASQTRRVRAFLKLAAAGDLREANLKAQVDLWLIRHGLEHWIDAAGIVFKRRKRARLDE